MTIKICGNISLRLRKSDLSIIATMTLSRQIIYPLNRLSLPNFDRDLEFNKADVDRLFMPFNFVKGAFVNVVLLAILVLILATDLH